MSKKERSPTSDRLSVITAVTTPLAFFVLALVIAEGILAANAITADATTRRYLIFGMMALIFCLVGIVALFFRNPRTTAGAGTPEQIDPGQLRFSIDTLASAAEHALRQVLADCAQDPVVDVSADSIVAKLLSQHPKTPSILVETAVQSHLTLLSHLGAISSAAGTASPVSALGAGLLGSLAAHVHDGVPFLTGWDGRKDPGHFAWLRDTVRAIEERRLTRLGAQTTPSRTIKAVIILIKAQYKGEDVFLMEYNPRWDGGMWWFPGGILGLVQIQVTRR